MNERIKQLRREFNLTQAEFGRKVGLSRAEVANIESGRAPVRPATVPVICHILGVSQEWLETGHGEMVVKANSDIVSALADDYHLGLYGKQLLATYLELSDDDKRAVERFVAQLTANVQRAEDSLSFASDVPAEESKKAPA